MTANLSKAVPLRGVDVVCTAKEKQKSDIVLKDPAVLRLKSQDTHADASSYLRKSNKQ